MVHNFNRRHFLGTGALAGAMATMPGLFDRGARAQSAALNVFSPLPPDPAPPGAAKFSEDAFAKWQADNGATVSYETLAWPQLHDRMATAFASGAAPWDITYNCGWVPEFESFLTPYADNLPKALVDDLPPTSFATTTVGGKRYGAVFTLSLLTLFYNKELMEQAGFKEAPKTGLTYWLRVGAVVGLVSVAVQSLVEFSLQMPGNAAFFAVLAAIALHRSPRLTPKFKPTT